MKIFLQHFPCNSDSLKAKSANRRISLVQVVTQRSGAQTVLSEPRTVRSHRAAKAQPLEKRAKTVQKMLCWLPHKSQPWPANSNPHPAGRCPLAHCYSGSGRHFAASTMSWATAGTGSLASALQPKERVHTFRNMSSAKAGNWERLFHPSTWWSRCNKLGR